MININNLSFNYGAFKVLEDVSFSLEKGKLCALFGPNGSGKSTLLKCLAGLNKVSNGEVFINGGNLNSYTPKELARLVAYVPQEHKPPFPFKVKEVVLMGRTPHLGGFFSPSKADLDYTDYAMNIIGIDNIAERYYTELSGGQRQLVLLARSFAQNTPIMLLDEPTSALDFKNQINIWKILKSLASKGKTVVVCTHDPNYVSWFCDTVVFIKEGNLVKFGDSKEVMDNDILKLLYGDICSIEPILDMKVIIPSLSRIT
ncbi:MAG: Cobalamin import ATP-binding protein BtuD [Candidatus Methanofastidiosum methylothiophilum]|uniref:Cobalamin import ATP-binding protein BtuD n=1 Tax=Candidatus Methanofastidiosum methylothiophilum TaxID=1705564 RepID=A0A150IVU3_9EURY|nr:MAG: Cobalamin import ATP-binding protein BtuD [Candidatus Methanofastidiosum methylthiophilus]